MTKCAVCDSKGSPLTAVTDLDVAQQALSAQWHRDTSVDNIVFDLCKLPRTITIFHNKGCHLINGDFK